ncbi:hypothetical protein CC78DRAFT_541535 [Lojkania enalia]|uniref:Zn(2)-C6 fungal-type domain-containing protein n=1 Tax=Lojkania enalia TaxID=147567 RepID=A0A9P4N5V7_9PLEO|nr:hypothetical protein CC78DRAFT_541535 [Didymosphaeria enalia]
MECIAFDIINTPSPSPSVSCCRITRLLAKKNTRTMLSSRSSTPRKNEKQSKQNSPSNRESPPSNELTEMSDVPCYTCRRRHVKCDRQLPTCAKCAKKGVPCLGYRKPLRWAEGVAVRGKLKGKSQPVVDTQVVNIVQETLSPLMEASQLQWPLNEVYTADVAVNEATLLELMAYHNSTICAERITHRQSRFVDRHIAPLSFDIIKILPRDIVNCILGNAAVHKASRQPGNRSLERLALETKAKVYQSFNSRLQSPHNQQPDVVVSCGMLIFAMDLFEQGMARWIVHFLGSTNIMASFGGMETLAMHYPHLRLSLAHVVHLETFWILLSPVPVTRAKQASRKALDLLCNAPEVKHKFFTPCPMPLTLAIWDIGDLASKLLGFNHPITHADLYQRDQILLDVLSYRPEEGCNSVKEFYYKDVPLTEDRLRSWDLVSTAWKGAVTILILRYLYFGRSSLALQTDNNSGLINSSQTGASAWFASRDELGGYYQTVENQGISSFIEDSESSEGLSDYLSSGLDLHDPLSRSPSPMPPSEPPASSLWSQRYKIHDDAFSALSSSLFALHDMLDPVCVRFIVLPLLMLGLVSRPNSPERALCFSFFAKYKENMAATHARQKARTPPCPQGGEELQFDIPWDRLDAYSQAIEQRHQAMLVGEGEGPSQGAPEWNWWDMLNNTQLNLVWPITSGTSHFEFQSEFWAFGLISCVVNEECFATWTRGQSYSASHSPSSSA